MTSETGPGGQSTKAKTRLHLASTLKTMIHMRYLLFLQRCIYYTLDFAARNKKTSSK